MTIQSGHKPLENILKKSLEKVPNCVQEILLALQTFYLEVLRKPAREILIADALSRDCEMYDCTTENNHQFSEKLKNNY